MGCCISRIERSAWSSWYGRACTRLRHESAWHNAENKEDFLNRLELFLPHELDAVYVPLPAAAAPGTKHADMRIRGTTIDGCVFELALDSAGLLYSKFLADE